MNRMKKVAQLLGVELNEEFEITDKECTFRITKDGLEVLLYKNLWCPAKNDYFVSLIKGTSKIKKPILSKQEREYLETVIAPFKDKVEHIVKYSEICDEDYEYIAIIVKNDYSVCFPKFKSGSMYKNMKRTEFYTLKELGLFKHE